jgi:hypothetical protein
MPTLMYVMYGPPCILVEARQHKILNRCRNITQEIIRNRNMDYWEELNDYIPYTEIRNGIFKEATEFEL